MYGGMLDFTVCHHINCDFFTEFNDINYRISCCRNACLNAYIYKHIPENRADYSGYWPNSRGIVRARRFQDNIQFLVFILFKLTIVAHLWLVFSHRFRKYIRGETVSLFCEICTHCLFFGPKSSFS